MAIVDAVCLQTRLRKRVYTVKYAHRILLYPLYSQPCVELLKPPSGLQNREVVGKTLDATPSKCLDKHLRELSHSLTLVVSNVPTRASKDLFTILVASNTTTIPELCV